MKPDVVDRIYALVRRPTRLFRHGWGLPAAWGERLPGLDEICAAVPAPLSPKYARARRDGGHWIREGTIESPHADLPPEVRSLAVRRLDPRGREPRAALIFFGQWGDEGFETRTRLLAPLVDDGLAVVLPATPFFGRRRPSGQRGIGLRTVFDFLALGHAAVEEARGLLSGLAVDGHTRLGVGGFSMGGQIAALTAALFAMPLEVITIAPSESPASVFCRGPLGRAPDWRRLEADGLGPALPRLRRVFDHYAVTRLPVPVDPARARVIGTERDLIVPPDDARRIAAHWPGSRLGWLPSGHVAAWVVHRGAIRAAIRDAFA